jgi:hypothetical protein
MTKGRTIEPLAKLTRPSYKVATPNNVLTSLEFVDYIKNPFYQ